MMKRTSNLSDIILLNPGLPMVHQGIPSSVIVLVLAERPFVDDALVASVLK